MSDIHTIAIHSLSKQFLKSSSPLFANLSYTFHSNVSYALMGPSGVGKSTLLSIISGLEPFDKGDIAYDSAQFSFRDHLAQQKFTKSFISIAFQQPCFIAELSVCENVMIKAVIKNQITQEAKEHAQQLLYDIGLLHLQDFFVHTLSGGQQQRISLLQSLFYIPKFLLVDEPTSSLDVKTAQEIMQLLLFFKKKYSMGLIISTHDPSVAVLCDRIIKIENTVLQ